MTSDEERTAKIRALNDQFRKTCTQPTEPGGVMITAGVDALGAKAVAEILEKVAVFNSFSNGNDPWREHDFSSFEHGDETIFWKLDYYAHDLVHGSEDPADATKTKRVLTIMLSSEY